jgi:hypothetical protein
MKKIKVENKLNLNKESVSKLTNENMNNIQGGAVEARPSFITLCRSCINHGSPVCGTCVSCVC